MRLRYIGKIHPQRARLLGPDVVAALDDVDPTPPAGERTRKLAKLLQRDAEWIAPETRRGRKLRRG